MVLPLLCVLGLAQGLLWPTTNGHPGCRTHYELTRLWRNNFRPELYWECTTLGVPAVSRNCAPETVFLEHWQTCVPLSKYEDTPFYEPPSRPEDAVEICPPCPPCETTTVRPPAPFICTEDRMGVRWVGDTENTYWECLQLNQEPILITCPQGFMFSFPLQTCIAP